MKSARISIGGLDNKYHTPLYILITITLFTILSIITLSIRFALTGAAGNEGNATLTNVSIKQAGTGQSVTIDNVTMDETAYGTNESRRTILNNNVVRYSATYSITTPGVIELSIALPANNTIDEATIGSAQGCITGSKLEKATVDGKTSYTNNKATCIKNVSLGTTNTTWDITAYPWGANNEQITPTLAINNQAQDIQPEPITVIGKPNYGIVGVNNGYTGLTGAGMNYAAAPDFSIYIPLSETDVIGVEPIDNFSFVIETSSLPSDWGIYRCMDDDSGASLEIPGGGESLVNHNKDDLKLSCSPSSDKTTLTVTVDNILTAVRDYKVNGYGYNYLALGLVFEIPAQSLIPSVSARLYLDDGISLTKNGEYIIKQYNDSLSYQLSGADSGSVLAYVIKTVPPGWLETNLTSKGPLYVGEAIPISPYVTSRVYSTSKATNLDYCITVDSSTYSVVEYEKTAWSAQQDFEYGVLNYSDGATPDVTLCGSIGDDKTGASFFSDIEDARAYAKSINSDGVNAVRIHISSLNNVINGVPGNLTIRLIKELNDPQPVSISLYARTDQWTGNVYTGFAPRPVPGLLSHTITAIPSSTAPNTEDHITITTKTYNKDTNSKITTILPNGLIPKAGSFTITNKEGNKLSLTEGDNQDYTLSSGCYANSSSSTSTTSDGCTITFNLDNIVTNTGILITGYDPILPGQTGTTNGSNTITNPNIDNGGDGLPIAADNDGNGITHTNTPIEFDVVVDKDTPTPSTLTINSTTSGTGTNYASSTFKEAKASVLVAEEQSFGYNLTSNATSLDIGDDLSYTYSTSNLSNTDITNLDAITVLPFNNDSRGTNGLIENSNLVDPTSQSITANNPGYLVRDIILTKSSTSQSQADTSTIPNPTIYFTVDNLARELEQTNPAELATNNEINWVQCQLEERSDGSLYCASLPTNAVISALRWSMDTVPQGTRYFINLTLAGIDADNDSIIANNISYLQTDNFGANTNLLTTRTTYDGETLSLDLDKDLLQVAIDPDSVMIGGDSLTNILTAITSTKRGYHLTMNVVGATNDLAGQTNPANRIPAISSKPTKGTKGWAVSLNNQGTWQAIPTGANPLTIKQMAIKGQDNFTKDITYGISTSQNTIADTYRAGIVYTLTAEP